MRCRLLALLALGCVDRPLATSSPDGGVAPEADTGGDVTRPADGGLPTFPDGQVGVFCGDGRCNGLERCATCAEDCGPCTTCGDGACGADEDCAVCAPDCGLCPECGDGACRGEESCERCTLDCGLCAECGDGFCEGAEDCISCAPDCGGCPGCGDGSCNASVENCTLCPADCGGCPSCGMGGCGDDETCFSCEIDCGVCSVCGNGSCERFESCVNCPSDCGSCPVYDCFEMMTCLFGCGFDELNIQCFSSCIAQGCADAQSAAQQFLDCAIEAVLFGCGDMDFSCIQQECQSEFLTCLEGFCSDR